MTALTDPSVQLARAFGRRVADWVRTTGAAAADVDSVTFAAEMLSLATSGGHVCLYQHSPFDRAVRAAHRTRLNLLVLGIKGRLPGRAEVRFFIRGLAIR